MERTENISKKVVAQALIETIQKESRTARIKTDLVKGFGSPIQTMEREKELRKNFTPDISTYKKNQANFYEIELNDNFKVEKWKYFARKAQENKGEFYIILPDWLRPKAKKQLQENNIDASIIYFNT
ncbi:MAG: hypothetical protein ACOCUL_00820 [Bacteroidota bacterium]